MTSTTDAYRQRVYTASYEICIERAKYYTESYKETEGLHPDLRAARALQKTLANMTLYILDEEQIVGNRSSKLVGTVIQVERGEINKILEMELQNLKKRDFKPFHIDPADERDLVKNILPYWEGKTLRDRKVQLTKRFGLFWNYNWSLRS